MPRDVFHIFLSSTSTDLQDCRAMVRDMVDRMRQTTIRMETFGARPTKPLVACREEVQKCDALIVIVGQRYGWVPTKKEGGDGIRSITWWEVKWAVDAKKPVFAFLVDPKRQWNMEREQDRLTTAKTNKEVLAISKAVRSLQRFRAFLERKTTRELFASVEDLGGKVVSSLHPWVLEQAITAERETLSQQSQSSGLFLASLTQGRGPSSDLENIYWQERAHLLSAQRLAGPTKNVRIALIAGTPNLAHPALSARSIIRVDLRPTGRHGSYVENIFDEYGTAIASVLIGRETAGPCRGIARESELVVLPVGGQWVVWKDQERATLDPVDYLVALRAVVRDGIRVVCLPFTGAGHPTSIEADSLRSAADEGVIIVCPAGSDRTGEPDYPAANPNCIGVGAVDEYNRLVSNVGDWIATTVSATDIPVAVGSECYEKWSGARVGCAVVSGVVALMLTVNPELTLNQIRRILRTTGPLVLDNEGTQVQGGLRLLDAYYAVRAASEKYEGVGASN